MSHAKRLTMGAFHVSSSSQSAPRFLLASLMLALLAVASCAGGSSQVATSEHDAAVKPGSQPAVSATASNAPETACESALQPGLTVVRAFGTTVGGVRQWQAQQISRDSARAGEAAPSGSQSTWSSEKSATSKAVLCYLDGTINKAPPQPAGGAAPEPFNRAVVAVLEDGSAIAVTLGYQQNIPVNAPPP
jgi:hypothetical protein